MRELGHRGGTSRRKGVAEQLPETERQSLREFLRDGLDRGSASGLRPTMAGRDPLLQLWRGAPAR
jgi:hypothetical protein